MPKILQKDASYTFRSYFEMAYDTDEILAEFGYSYTQARLTLPKTQKTLTGISALKQQIEETLPYVQLTSESAKREVLVAPVLTRVATICHQILRFEYPLKINNWLQINLDYLIRAQHQVVVIEAKRDNLTRGFTQLAVEMIALAAVEGAPNEIYGAVTMGSLWVFGKLDNNQKRITQDISSYKVPDEIEQIMSILVGLLEK